MLYTSYPFILLFLPLVLLGYYSLSHLKNAIYQKVFLISMSLFFYGVNNTYYLILFVVSVLLNYIFALCIKKHINCFFPIGIIFDILLLGYFKYFNFFVDNINHIFKTSYLDRAIVLPLGISFFTFQQISFLISVKKKECFLDSFLDYCEFMTFFPQIIAGPIVLYQEFVPQIRNHSNRHFNSHNLCQGIYQFSMGAFKKSVLADSLSLFVDNGFQMNEIGFAASWITALSYTFQIYFDFSGYSDMAIGIGKMFNYDLPQNFDSPYKSESINEFWRRWHKTLGRALSTYVYIPLGGNKKGLSRTCINLLVTFFLSGFWHGASWTFIIWGVMHGCVCIIERIFNKYISAFPKAIKVTITFLITNSLWVLFRADNFNEANKILTGMLNFTNAKLYQLQELTSDGFINFPGAIDTIYVISFTIISAYVCLAQNNSSHYSQKFTPNIKTAFQVGLFLMATIICLSKGSVFIYFNF